MRLFAALPLPAAAVERLTSLRLRLSGPGDGLRWSTPEQWHVTLQFYGEVGAVAERCLKQALEQLTASAPAIALEALGLFPAKGILYVEVVLSASLEQLHMELQQAATRCGLAVEKRIFRPHITLARSKGKIGYRTLQHLASPQVPSLGRPVQWLATDCLLLESTLRPGGAEYRVVHQVELAAPSKPFLLRRL